MTITGPVRSMLQLTGKRDRKVAVVFGLSPVACERAVEHLRQGAPGLPVWLYATEAPSDATNASCERVCIRRSTLLLLARAHADLWDRWVALAVATWTGERGRWAAKLAPFTFPPFRTLLLNNHGDFFPGRPGAIARHDARRLRDAAHRVWNRVRHASVYVIRYPMTSAISRRMRHEVFGRGLQACAILLRWAGYPQRRWIAKFNGRDALDLTLTGESYDTVERFTPGPSGWDWKLFETAVRGSSARWLLWREHAGHTNLEDLLPLFSEENTFAVSVQEHYRGWHPSMLPMAPFRVLQPGEACRVLAPFSRTMLVDRKKLAALGVPHCSLAGSTWMELFWKAAAAGWKSYSVGRHGPVERQPDLPMEEAEFALRLLANRRLRRLQPRDPDLSRGTIARATVRTGSACGDRPRVLVLSPFLPYPLTHGGAVRIFNLCRALAGDVDFALIAVREQNEQVDYGRLHEIFQEVSVVDLDERAPQDGSLPKQVLHYRSRSLHAAVASMCEESKPDVLQVEYTQLAGYRDAAPDLPALLVEHDITFSLYRQFAADAKETEAEYIRWRDFEGHWLKRFEAVWTMSEEDRALAIDAGSGAARTTVVPNGVDTARYVPVAESGGAEVLYVGSFRHLPNVIGFDKLRREIMPRVWERFPEARLRVVAGPDYETFWHRYAHNGSARIADRRITIHGFIEDLRPLYASAAVVVAPLEVSAGTNIKVLEAMACGRALVSTPVGCAGLGLRHGKDAMICGEAAAFANAVCDLLDSPGLRARMGAQARRTVESRFDWRGIAQRAYTSYLELINLHHSMSRSEIPWRGRVNASERVPPAAATQWGESSISS